MSCVPEPAMQSCDTGQQIPFFHSCQLITLWMSNTKFYTDSIKVCHLAPADMKWCTYERTIFSEPKFLGSIDYHIFLPMVLPCVRFARERAPLQFIFFSEQQPLYGNYSTLVSPTNTVISYTVAYSSRWLPKPWQALFFIYIPPILLL